MLGSVHNQSNLLSIASLHQLCSSSLVQTRILIQQVQTAELLHVLTGTWRGSVWSKTETVYFYSFYKACFQSLHETFWIQACAHFIFILKWVNLFNPQHSKAANTSFRKQTTGQRPVVSASIQLSFFFHNSNKLILVFFFWYPLKPI